MEPKFKKDDILTPSEARRYLKLSKQIWIRLRDAGLLPPGMHFGERSIRYRKETLNMWMRELEKKEARGDKVLTSYKDNLTTREGGQDGDRTTNVQGEKA